MNRRTRLKNAVILIELALVAAVGVWWLLVWAGAV